MMEENKNAGSEIDEYISNFPAEQQEKLQSLRASIKETVPEAKEKISWRMPTFELHGNLVHFAAHKNHVGFYPGPDGIERFRHELAEYKSSKGAVQFPWEKPLPFDLIRRIVLFRVEANKKQAEKKAREKSKK